MRIVFLGNVADYSTRFLEALATRSADPADPVSVVGVVCPAVRPGRFGDLTFDAKRRFGDVLDRLSARPWPAGVGGRIARAGGGVHRQLQKHAHRCGAPVWWPESTDDTDFREQIAGLDADLGIVAGLDRILKADTLASMPPLFNVHPSMLPDFRGPAPEFWQLDAGLSHGGVTIHRIDSGIDTGPIVLQRTFPIDPWLDVDGFIDKSVILGTQMVNELLDAGAAELDSHPVERPGSYQPMPDPEMSFVLYDRDVQGAFDRARAIGFRHPMYVNVPAADWHARRTTSVCEPSATSTVLTLHEPVPHPEAPSATPGSIVATPAGGAVVWCRSGALEFRHATAPPSPTAPSRKNH